MSIFNLLNIILSVRWRDERWWWWWSTYILSTFGCLKDTTFTGDLIHKSNFNWFERVVTLLMYEYLEIKVLKKDLYVCIICKWLVWSMEIKRARRITMKSILTNCAIFRWQGENFDFSVILLSTDLRCVSFNFSIIV